MYVQMYIVANPPPNPKARQWCLVGWRDGPVPPDWHRQMWYSCLFVDH